jgi:putative heme iron utilization protein
MAQRTLAAENGGFLAWQGQTLDATEQSRAGFPARCLLRGARWATLATQQAPASAPYQPFASLITHTMAPDGAVLMLLSSLAAHATHLAANPYCAVMVTGRPENLNWQTAPRVSVTGRAEVADNPALRAYWLARHPYARLYAQFTDFFLWRMVPEAGLYVGGFGQAADLGSEAFTSPKPAIESILAATPGLMAHCNEAHAESLTRLAQAAGASGPWLLLGVDTDGFDLVQDEAVLRMAFPAPVADGAAARAALLRLIEKSRRFF